MICSASLSRVHVGNWQSAEVTLAMFSHRLTEEICQVGVILGRHLAAYAHVFLSDLCGVERLLSALAELGSWS